MGDEIEKLPELFSLSLIGKFALWCPNMDQIRVFYQMLKLSSAFLMGLIEATHVFIKFENDLDYTHVFAQRFDYVYNYQMRLLK